jgi:bacterioferritin
MTDRYEHSDAMPPPANAARHGLVLDLAAIEAARSCLEQGAVTPSCGPWRADLIELLNDALASELVSVLRYRRHHFTADGLVSPSIADAFLAFANDESAHADQLAQRIVQLGGQPDFSPDSLTRRSRVAYDESPDLTAMVRANLVAERVAIETYCQMIRLIGDEDPGTRRLIEDILCQEQEHADDLKDWLVD